MVATITVTATKQLNIVNPLTAMECIVDFNFPSTLGITSLLSFHSLMCVCENKI